MKKFQYDYYVIDIPSDFSEDTEERSDIAIMQARERTRLYCMPCEWTVTKDTGELVTVRRKRNIHRKGGSNV